MYGFVHSGLEFDTLDYRGTDKNVGLSRVIRAYVIAEVEQTKQLK